MSFPRLPLVLIFVGQSLLVIGAFVALLMVLTEQQHKEFQDGLTKRLGLQQRNAMATVAFPLQQRVAQSTTALYDFRTALPANPQWIPAHGGNATIGQYEAFYRRLFPVVATDPLVSNIALMIDNRDNATVTDTISNDSDTAHTYYWDGFELQVKSASRYHNNQSWVCHSEAPGTLMNLSKCAFGVPFENNVPFSLPATLTRFIANRTVFLAPIAADFTTLGIFFIYPLMVPVRWRDPHTKTMPDVVIAVTLNVPFVRDAVAAAVVSEVSVAALHVYAHGTCHLMASKGIAPEIRRMGSAILFWTCGESPDMAVNQFWRQANDLCAPLVVGPGTGSSTATGCSEPIVMEFSHGATKYVGTTQRLRTAENFDLLLLQHTPRNHFYGQSEAARLKGPILIGTFAAVGVVLVCAAVLFALWLPLRALQANMDLAAQMRNDEVSAVRPVLLEAAALVKAFDAMNSKLLLARPFLPQSLLLAVAGATDDDSGGGAFPLEDREDDEGEVFAQSVELIASNSPTPDGPSSFSNDVESRLSSGDMSSTRATTNAFPDVALVTSVLVSSGEGADSASFGGRRRRHRVGGGDGGPSSDTFSAGSGCDHRGVAAARTRVGESMTQAQSMAARGAHMIQKRVAVLVINMRGFHHAQRTHIPDTLARLQRGLAEIVEQQTALQRGIVDHFHGDHFVCAFNAARSCAQPALCAAQTALATDATYRSTPTLENGFPGGLSMGLSCGRALVGNMGTATMQRLSVVGEAYGEAAALQQCMAQLVLPQLPSSTLIGRCIALGRTVSEVEHRVEFQVLGTVPATRVLSAISSTTTSEAQDASRRGDDRGKQEATSGTALRVRALNAPFTTAPPRADRPGSPHRLVVACICNAREAGHTSEWLYELSTAQDAGLGPLNAALCGLILHENTSELQTVSNGSASPSPSRPSPPAFLRPSLQASTSPSSLACGHI